MLPVTAQVMMTLRLSGIRWVPLSERATLPSGRRGVKGRFRYCQGSKVRSTLAATHIVRGRRVLHSVRLVRLPLAALALMGATGCSWMAATHADFQFPDA